MKWCAAALLLMGVTVSTPAAAQVVVGSKKFTESVILGELCCLVLERAGARCQHRRELGGTQVLWKALVRGDLQIYPEYTGTIAKEILGRDDRPSDDALREALRAHGIVLSAPLGFNNGYVLGMKGERAAALGIARISDLRQAPRLVFRFSDEFMDRADGWPGLKAAYALPQEDVRGIDHDLAYRGLEAGDVDVTDLYSTDAEIAYYRLAALADDRGYFPRYDAVLLYRADIEAAHAAAIEQLGGGIDETLMSRMNARAKIEGRQESEAAAELAGAALGLDVTATTDTRRGRLLRYTLEHLALVGASLFAAILAAIPLGILAARHRRFGQLLLGAIGVVQTVPSLALLVFMIPLLGIGAPPAVVALFLYSLLPIVRNTHQGLTGIRASLLEAADAIGLPRRARLWRIELPLATPAILAGIKTSAVINVGTATLGALVGAGGYGQPIVTGIRRDDLGLIMEGAVPAALLALAAQGMFDLCERYLVPRGLRS